MLAIPNMILQESVNLVTENIYYSNDQTIWTSRQFTTANLTSLPNSYNVNMVMFSNSAVRPMVCVYLVLNYVLNLKLYWMVVGY